MSLKFDVRQEINVGYASARNSTPIFNNSTPLRSTVCDKLISPTDCLNRRLLSNPKCILNTNLKSLHVL